MFTDVISRRNQRSETKEGKKTRKDPLCPESLRSDGRGAGTVHLPNKPRGAKWLSKLGAGITFIGLKLSLKNITQK